jgi:hypothetical protein
MQPFKALLVEGTSGVGKSTFIDALLRRHISNAKPRKIRSLIHLAQSHTYGPLAKPEDAHTLTVEENLAHLERIVGGIEWLHACVQDHDRPWGFMIVDTLHLTHCVRPGVVRWNDVATIDRRLATIDCKLLFLEASPGSIWERGIAARANSQFILEYARKFGQTQEEIHRYFVKEQDAMAVLFESSVMPKLKLKNDLEIENSLDEVYEFWAGEVARDAGG